MDRAWYCLGSLSEPGPLVLSPNPSSVAADQCDRPSQPSPAHDPGRAGEDLYSLSTDKGRPPGAHPQVTVTCMPAATPADQLVANWCVGRHAGAPMGGHGNTLVGEKRGPSSHCCALPVCLGLCPNVCPSRASPLQERPWQLCNPGLAGG